MELNHNIGFTLGDYSCDGHCKYQDYHLVSNYSASDITNAYNDLVRELNWDFLNECHEYEDMELSEKGEEILLQLDILTEDKVKQSKSEWDSDFYTVEDIDQFVDIFFKLVAKKLPDLEWDYRNLKEKYLKILDGAGYGLFGS